MLDDLDRDVLLEVDGLDEGDLVDFGLDLNLRDDDGDFDVFLDLSDLDTSLVDDFRDLDLDHLVLLHDSQHLPDDFYLLGRQFHNPLGRHQFLHDLRDSHNHLLHMDNRHYLLDNLLHYLDPGLNVRHDLRDLLITDYFDYLFDNLRDCDYLLPLDNFLDYLLDYNFDRLGDFFLGLHVSHHFLDDLHWSDLLLDHNLLHLDHHWLLHLHDLIPMDLLRLRLGLLADLDNHALV